MDGFYTEHQLAEIAAEEAQLARAAPLEGDKLWDPVQQPTPKRSEDEETLGDGKQEFVDACVEAYDTTPADIEAAGAKLAAATQRLTVQKRAAHSGKAYAETQPSGYTQLRKPEHVSTLTYDLLAEISPLGHQLFLHELPEKTKHGVQFGGWMKTTDLNRYGWQGRNSVRFSMSRRDWEKYPSNLADLPPSTHVYMPQRKKDQYDYLLNCVNHYATKDAVRFGGQSRKAMRSDALRKVELWWEVEKPPAKKKKKNPFAECFGASSAFDPGE